MCHGYSVTTLADVLLALLAVEGCKELVVYDAVSTQQGPEEHQPALDKLFKQSCITARVCLHGGLPEPSAGPA